jgi:Domain of unknown function (DUF4157)/Bacterial EndoU nuclease
MFAPPIKAPKAKAASQSPPARASKPPQQRPVRPGLGSAEQILALQRTIGNQAVLRLLAKERQNLPGGTPADGQPQAADPKREASPEGPRSASWDFSKIPLFAPNRPSGPQAPRPFIQPKLMIGRGKDPLEHEADRIANHVMARPAHQAVSAAPLSIQRLSTSASREMKAAPASVDRVLAGAGRPLEPAVRQDMEQRFNHDFSRVRVHAGAAAEQSARDVNAHAYTAAHNVVFGAGRFAPGTHDGRRLIAHELTHVVQQSASTSSPVAIQRDADKDLTADRVRDLKEYVASHPSPYKYVIQIIRFSQKQDLDDNVAADFVESLSAAQLEHFASTPEGREMLDVLYNAMMTGHVTSHETLQADRIVYAKWKFSPAEVYKVAQLSDPDAAPTPIVLTARKRADELNHLAASKRYRDVIAGVRENSFIEDDIAARFLTLQHPDRLEAYAATDEGRVMLGVLYDALITGDVTEFERLQADRILAAKAKTVRAPAAADIAKAVREPAIFPLETSWGSTATIRAELLPNAKVKVYYDSRTGLGSKEFARERASLYDRYGESVYSGIILEADEPVIVKLFDQGGSIVTVPAIKLIDFFNQQKEDTLGKIKTVSVMAATVGLGGIGAGGILGWADTIAFAINAGTLFIKANRDVIAKTAFGRRFLEAWDVAEGMVEYYNWGRLGVDGLKLVHATVSVPFKQWRQEVAAGLTSAERDTIAKAQQQTDAWLDAVKKAEAAEAAKAAKPAAADSQANAAPRGSQSRTGYSQTPPTSEEDIAAAAGKTRRRPGIDRGKGARPRYANDPVKPKVTGAPIKPIEGHTAQDVFANYAAKKHVFEGDFKGGYHSTAREPNTNATEVGVIKKRAAPGVEKAYKIKVEIRDANGEIVEFTDAAGKVKTYKESTMFPDHLTEQQVMDEVYEVMVKKHKTEPLPPANAKGMVKIEGVSPRGYHIIIEVGMNGETLFTFYAKK